MTRYFVCLIALISMLTVLDARQEASAHAVLLGSSPKAEEMLDVSPEELILNFNENVGPIFFKVLNTQGQEVGAPGEIRVKGNDVLMSLGETLPNGTYVMTYRVISADTHPVGASVIFSVGEPIQAGGDVVVGDTEPSAWQWPVIVNRYLLYGSMLLAAGSAFFALWMSTPANVTNSVYRLGRLGAVVLAVTFVLSIGLGGAEMVMGGASALFAPATWITGAGSTLGPSALIGIPAAIVLFMAFGRDPENQATALLLIGAALAVGSFLVTGHAATAMPVWLMATMVAVHLVCASFWLAALWPLSKATRSMPVAEAGALMTQFSNRAILTVTALFLSGAVISWVQVEAVSALFSTDYGLRLAGKLAVFFALLGLAAYNKLSLTPALEKADESAAGRLRNTIRLEFIAFLLIIGAAVSLTLVTPPRALADMSSGSAGAMAGAGTEGFTATAERSGFNLKLEVTPARTGENMVMFTVTDAQGNAVDTKKVESVWSLPSAGLEGIEQEPEQVAPGVYHLMFTDLIIPGDWEVRVGVFVTDFDKYNFTITVPIK